MPPVVSWGREAAKPGRAQAGPGGDAGSRLGVRPPGGDGAAVRHGELGGGEAGLPPSPAKLPAPPVPILHTNKDFFG